MEDQNISPTQTPPPIQPTPVSSLPENPIAPSVETKKFPVLIIVLVILVLGLAATAFFLVRPKNNTSPIATPTTTPTATATTNQTTTNTFNSTFGYSIKYASDWIVQPLTQQTPGQPDFVLYSPDSAADLNLGDINKGVRININILQNGIAPTPPNTKLDNSFLPSNIVSNAQGYQNPQFHQTIVNITNGKSTYIVNCFVYTPTNFTCNNALNQILSTLQFTK